MSVGLVSFDFHAECGSGKLDTLYSLLTLLCGTLLLSRFLCFCSLYSFLTAV
jgi:hypothetical protein